MCTLVGSKDYVQSALKNFREICQSKRHSIEAVRDGMEK